MVSKKITDIDEKVTGEATDEFVINAGGTDNKLGMDGIRITASQTTDFNAQVQTSRLDQMAASTAIVATLATEGITIERNTSDQIIKLSRTVGNPGSGFIYANGNDMFGVNDVTAYPFLIKQGATTLSLVIDTTKVALGVDFDIQSNNIIGISALQFDSDTEHKINDNATNLDFRVPINDSFRFIVNGIVDYTFSGTTFNIHGNTITNTGVLTLPTSTDTLIGRATTDTLINKSIIASQLTGIIADARMPNITGDVTTVEGAVASTIGAKKVTTGMMADGTDGELITWGTTGVIETVAVGTATHVLTSNGVGTAPTFQAAGGGSQTPWTSDIDADGFDLKDLSNIEFRDTTGAPAGTITAIWADAGGLNLNFQTSDSIEFQRAGTAEYNFNNSRLDMRNNTLDMGTGKIQFGGTTNTIKLVSSDLEYDVSTGNTHRFRINDVTEWEFSSTGLTIGDANNIILNTTTGTKIGTATTQKLAFYNSPPVVQPTALTAEDATAINSTYDAVEEAVLNNVRTRLGEIETKFQALGLLA